MKAIWKYPLRVVDEQNVPMPAGAKILTVQMQGETPCLWAEVETRNHPPQLQTIRIYGTGHEMDPVEQRYIGTFQLGGGALVFHVYEVTP